MWLSDSYDVPNGVAEGPHSTVFAKFLRSWFADTYAIPHGELDIRFLEDLSPEELSLARELIRRNLKSKRNHIIEGAAALRDPDAIPILRGLRAQESDMSRRLTMAGALWKIDRDPIFVDCLREARSVRAEIFGSPHLYQVLWLDDERALDFLIGLLEVKERTTVYSFTLGLLNELESGQGMVHHSKMPHQPEDYRKLQKDPVFRAHMVTAIRKRNAESTNGW